MSLESEVVHYELSIFSKTFKPNILAAQLIWYFCRYFKNS
jgi:hypothetical protein